MTDNRRLREIAPLVLPKFIDALAKRVDFEGIAERFVTFDRPAIARGDRLLSPGKNRYEEQKQAQLCELFAPRE